MKAGRDGNQKSVSPLEIDNVENGSDGDNEDMEKDPEGWPPTWLGSRLKLRSMP